MSLEAAIAKLTTVLEENNALLRGATPAVATTATETSEANDDKDTGGPGFWKSSDGAFGQHANAQELDKAKEDHPSVEVIDKTEYLKLKKAADAKAAADKKAKAAADKKAKEDAAAAKQEADAGAEEEHPSEEDLIAAFTKFLPKDLDKEERAARAPKVKAYLEKAGAKRATDLKPEQRADAIAFVEGLVAELDGGDSDDDMI